MTKGRGVDLCRGLGISVNQVKRKDPTSLSRSDRLGVVTLFLPLPLPLLLLRLLRRRRRRRRLLFCRGVALALRGRPRPWGWRPSSVVAQNRGCRPARLWLQAPRALWQGRSCTRRRRRC